MKKENTNPELQLDILEMIHEHINRPTNSLIEELFKIAQVNGMLESYRKNFITDNK